MLEYFLSPTKLLPFLPTEMESSARSDLPCCLVLDCTIDLHGDWDDEILAES